MHTVIGIAGSLRAGSLNRALIAAAAARAPQDMRLDVFDAVAGIPLYDADLESADPPGPPPIRELRERVEGGDGLLIATPEYNQSLPAVTKNVVDWLSRAGGGTPPLRRMPVAIMGASDGPWGTRYAQKELRHTLTASGALVLPSPMVFVSKADEVFDDDRRLTDDALGKRIDRLLAAFADWMATFSR